MITVEKFFANLFNHPNRDAMPVLVNRINLITTKYATLLGSTIAGQLLAIGTGFNAARTAHVSTNGYRTGLQSLDFGLW